MPIVESPSRWRAVVTALAPEASCSPHLAAGACETPCPDGSDLDSQVAVASASWTLRGPRRYRRAARPLPRAILPRARRAGAVHRRTAHARNLRGVARAATQTAPRGRRPDAAARTLAAGALGAETVGSGQVHAQRPRARPLRAAGRVHVRYERQPRGRACRRHRRISRGAPWALSDRAADSLHDNRSAPTRAGLDVRSRVDASGNRSNRSHR
jgi:hypothetical protein